MRKQNDKILKEDLKAHNLVLEISPTYEHIKNVWTYL